MPYVEPDCVSEQGRHLLRNLLQVYCYHDNFGTITSANISYPTPQKRPEDRFTMEQVLRHPWFDSVYSPVESIPSDKEVTQGITAELGAAMQSGSSTSKSSKGRALMKFLLAQRFAREREERIEVPLNPAMDISLHNGAMREDDAESECTVPVFDVTKSRRLSVITSNQTFIYLSSYFTANFSIILLNMQIFLYSYSICKTQLF